jgi:hypothetical protein
MKRNKIKIKDKKIKAILRIKGRKNVREDFLELLRRAVK